MNGRTNRTPKKRAAFLKSLMACGQITKSCEEASISRVCAYEWRAADEDFAAAWEEALSIGLSRLADEAYRRAHDGVEEPVFYKGEVVGHIQKYSDVLLMFLMKAHQPERYRDRAELKLSGEVGIELTDARQALVAKVAALRKAGDSAKGDS